MISLDEKSRRLTLLVKAEKEREKNGESRNENDKLKASIARLEKQFEGVMDQKRHKDKEFKNDLK